VAAYEDQHYIPRSYLKHFAFEGKVMLRRRAAAPHLAGVRTVAKAKHLYSLTLADGTRDVSAEQTIGEFESIAAEAFDALRHGGQIPRHGTPARHAIALFMGLQRVRTPEDANEWLVPAAVAKRAGTSQPTPEDVRSYLREVHIGAEPSDKEVRDAHDWIYATCAMGLPTKAEQLTLLFTTAIQFAPLLEDMNWSIEECVEPLFATCDRLPVTWHTPRDADSYEGVGIHDAEELWLPLDPRHLLVLRHGGNELRSRVEPDRARFVNQHLARHCYRAVFHDLRLVVGPDDMPMRDRRLTLIFAGGEVVDDNGPTGKELVHQWTPIRDDAWD
jgi:hypothetical protein